MPLTNNYGNIVQDFELDNKMKQYKNEMINKCELNKIDEVHQTYLQVKQWLSSLLSNNQSIEESFAKRVKRWQSEIDAIYMRFR